MSLKVLTLVFLRKEGEVLLGYKKRGFGSGKWNGFGGKVEPGESVAEGAAREVLEECGLVVEPSHLTEAGQIEFEFKGDPTKLEVHVFQTRSFTGEAVETEEMLPQWYREQEVPYSQMWLDDQYWYPYLFDNKKFKASFQFEGHEKIVSHCIDLCE